MKYVLLTFILIGQTVLASPQFDACAFDAALNEKPKKEGGLYRISIRPIARVHFKNSDWFDTDWACLPLEENYVGSVYLSKKTAKKLVKVKVGDTVRLVREFMNGALMSDGNVYDSEEFVIWNPKAYKVNKPLNVDAASGAH